MKRFLENGKSYSRMDEIVQDNDMLKKTAESYQKTIEELQSHRKLQVEEFAEKSIEWQEKEKKLTRDVKITEENSKKTYSKEIETLKADLKTAGREKSSLQSQLATTKQDFKGVKEELDVYRTKIKRYEQDLAQLDDTAVKTQ